MGKMSPIISSRFKYSFLTGFPSTAASHPEMFQYLDDPSCSGLFHRSLSLHLSSKVLISILARSILSTWPNHSVPLLIPLTYNIYLQHINEKSATYWLPGGSQGTWSLDHGTSCPEHLRIHPVFETPIGIPLLTALLHAWHPLHYMQGIPVADYQDAPKLKRKWKAHYNGTNV